jgi:hypothetical protein
VLQKFTQVHTLASLISYNFYGIFPNYFCHQILYNQFPKPSNQFRILNIISFFSSSAIWPFSLSRPSRPTGPPGLRPYLLTRAGKASRRPSPAVAPCRLLPTSRAMEQTHWLSPSLTETPPLPSLTQLHFLPLVHCGNGKIDGTTITVAARSSRPPPPPTDPYKRVPRPCFT